MRYLFILQHSPYASSMARESLDMALATAAFDHHVQLLFVGDGVYQLLSNQHSDVKQLKNIEKTLKVLSLYEIEDVFADSQAVLERKLQTERLLATQMLNSSEMQTLIAQADVVLKL